MSLPGLGADDDAGPDHPPVPPGRVASFVGQTRDVGRTTAVLVDFDDTLVDNSVVPAAVERACASIASVVDGLDGSSLLQANTASWMGYWPEVERLCWLGEMDVLDVSREVWRRALANCGYHDLSIADLAYNLHQQIAQEMDRLFGDVAAFLSALRHSGVPVALVTNSSSRSQRTRLATLGLDSAFDHVVISGEFGVAKPDRAIFLEALARLKVSAGDAWHVGHSLSTDIAGAAAAGLRSVWVNRSGRDRDPNGPLPTLEVTSLDGLVDRLTQP